MDELVTSPLFIPVTYGYLEMIRMAELRDEANVEIAKRIREYLAEYYQLASEGNWLLAKEVKRDVDALRILLKQQYLEQA